MRRSLLIGLGLDRGHVDQERRIAAARALRSTNPEGEVTEQGGEAEARQHRRLRERFGIRTRRRGQSDAQAQAQPQPVAENPAAETPATETQEEGVETTNSTETRPAASS